MLEIQNEKNPMVLIYNLKKDLENDPEHLELAQKLTLDKSRPLMGLKGTHGLFGSDEWWDSIYNKKMKLQFVSGVITSTFNAGQDSDRRHNSYELTLDNGSLHQESFYANNKKDKILYSIGKMVSIAYALDELKRQDRKNKYSRTPIEIAISKEIVPVESKTLYKLK